MSAEMVLEKIGLAENWKTIHRLVIEENGLTIFDRAEELDEKNLPLEYYDFDFIADGKINPNLKDILLPTQQQCLKKNFTDLRMKVVTGVYGTNQSWNLEIPLRLLNGDAVFDCTIFCNFDVSPNEIYHNLVNAVSLNRTDEEIEGALFMFNLSN